jgi:integrase
MRKKLPTAQQLPSGMYRCRIMVDGKRISVVDPDPNVAQAKALAVKNGLLEASRKPLSLTLGEAINRYIESKDAVLSPATIAGYKRIRNHALQGLMQVQLSDLTQEKIQRAVNAMAKTKSPKSVRNAHGLLSAVLSEYMPSMVLRTTLPQKKPYEAQIPSSEEIEKIIDISRGTVMELPILLAVWLGLRTSEIRGITWESMKDGILHVSQAIVEGEDGPELKGTKTYSGDRKIRLPAYIADLIQKQPQNGEYLVTLSGQAMYKRFSRLCEKAGIRHYRFHDLRHANASVMLALGIPDKYAMERMGHATNHMLKTVYQHTMKGKRDEVANLVDNYFTEKLDTNLDTKSSGN